ncbi:hypothetical protein Taro_027043 [Colocasia esculenta]|uniref:Uncharacterized protein n=1 Tax=Colocasia esculenta TaxID=4460 RepID=A0A843VLC4_COLES|nr:hypothetical protein [Colocasia esculenta]
MCATCWEQGNLRTSALRRRRPGPSRSGRDGTIRRVLNRKRSLNPTGRNKAQHALFGQGGCCAGFLGCFGVEACGEACSRRGKLVWSGRNVEGSPYYVFFMESSNPWRGSQIRVPACEGDGTPCRDRNATGRPVAFRRGTRHVDASRSWDERAISGHRILKFTASVLVYGLLELGEFPTEPMTSEAYPYSPQAKARRFRYRLPVQGRATVVLGQHLQQCSYFP